MASIRDLCNPESEEDQHYKPATSDYAHAPPAPLAPPPTQPHQHHPVRHHAQHYHPYPPPAHPSEQPAHYHHSQHQHQHQHHHQHLPSQPHDPPLPPPLPHHYAHHHPGQEHPSRPSFEQPHPTHSANDPQVHYHHHPHSQTLPRSAYESSQDFYARPNPTRPPYGHPSADTEAAGPTPTAPEPNTMTSPPEQAAIKTERSQQHSAPRRVSTHPEEQCLAKIKIVQQPLHARMCGFGEKDRRPIDPPPIVQLLLDEKHDQHPSKRLRRPGVQGADIDQDVGDEEESHEDIDNDEEDETYQLDEDDDDDQEEEKGASKSGGGTSGAKAAQRGGAGSLKHKSSSPPLGKRNRRAVSGSDNKAQQSATTDGDQSLNHSDRSHSGSDDGHGAEDDSEEGGPPEQDPLFVLHVSLWSHDGKEVRNMIATPGQSDPPKLTRILMGSLVVSPVLLNNAEGVPGWYFSFPDLSIRTEGVYTLKFSLMRFGSYDFLNSEDGHASTLVAEEISEPFTVFSAKKFPGMTESTELSKAFAKQGLKIPIRNDLRARKADKE
ncbi:hypothetical protein BGZ70_010154 [Mortierella alpina]|uniref:Velvet domain-containing protein n=1 Tax=Mortierella alpina TaxID=64518 RepID=A0A9P6M6A1_MORAP|nr:hypothetical protein BGZ70_010154 [Mortierella alpina]